MLRIILSVTGLVLIALGIFGGTPLDNLFQRSGGQPEQVAEVDAQKVEVALSTDTDSLVTSVASDPAVVGGEALLVSGEESVGQVAAVLPDAIIAPKVIVDVAASGEQASEVSSSVAKNLSPIAASNAVDSATALQKVSAAMSNDESKSTDRNAQVAMAKTSLPSSDIEAIQAVVADKGVEVSQTLKASAGQGENEMLMVVKDKVNMRDGPSINHPIVLQLAVGQELMEFKREGNWVHVGAYGTSGKIGWVHQRLVGPSTK